MVEEVADRRLAEQFREIERIYQAAESGLAAGTPVVAYREGGQVDILSGEEAGILVDGGTADFAAGVVALLKDHDRRFAMGKRGVSLVRDRFSVQAMVDSYLELFLTLRKNKENCINRMQ